MLMGACIYLVGRLSLEDRPYQGLWLMCLGLIAGTVLGAACKENAILLPVYIGVLEFTLLSQLSNQPRVEQQNTESAYSVQEQFYKVHYKNRPTIE